MAYYDFIDRCYFVSLILACFFPPVTVWFCFCPGFRCEEHDNPADFLLDVLNHCEGLRVPSRNLLALENSASQANTDLPLAYTQSAEYRATQTKCQTLMDNAEIKEKEKRNIFMSRAKYTTGFLWQVHVHMCVCGE